MSFKLLDLPLLDYSQLEGLLLQQASQRICVACLGYNISLVPQELADEGGVPLDQLRLDRDNLERVLMARLMEAPAVAQWPLHYLLACYSRASDEFRASAGIKDAAAVQRVQESLLYSKQLIVSYSGLLLTMDMFPQV